ncbi:MAG: type II toxin-antitoxin system Phd/YefM family antitoxin [Pseudomonadales bacterium]|nr:type II toxin-antitoxin system Phd/YefM family antitoxin [Pseudomonadales bacterium]
MTSRILAELATSITELKANPMKAVASGKGMPIAVLNRNEPAFYCIPAETYEKLIDKIEDLELLALANEREKDAAVKVNINDL